MIIDLKNMTPQESRGLAQKLGEMSPAQRKVMNYAIGEALKSDEMFDTEKVELPAS